MAALEAAQMAALERTNEAKWPEASIGFGTQVAILDFLSWKPEPNLVGQQILAEGVSASQFANERYSAVVRH